MQSNDTCGDKGEENRADNLDERIKGQSDAGAREDCCGNTCGTSDQISDVGTDDNVLDKSGNNSRDGASTELVKNSHRTSRGRSNDEKSDAMPEEELNDHPVEESDIESDEESDRVLIRLWDVNVSEFILSTVKEKEQYNDQLRDKFAAAAVKLA